MSSTKNLEGKLRSRARRSGYAIRKSRRPVSIDNFGEFMLVDVAMNLIVLGSRYDATLENIEEYLGTRDS